MLGKVDSERGEQLRGKHRQLSACRRLLVSSVAEPEPQGAETFWPEPVFEISAPAPIQIKAVFFTIIHLQEDQANDLNRYTFKKFN